MNETVKYIVDGIASGARAAVQLVVYVVAAYAVLVAMFIIAALGFLTLIGIETGIPKDVAPFTVIFGYVVALGLVPVEYVRQWIHNRHYELLHILDPKDGDAGVRQISPSRWEDIDVVVEILDEKTGEIVDEVEVDKDWLYRITMDTAKGARTGWECEYYDDKTNTAYVSYYGGISGTEVRRAGLPGVEQLQSEASVEREWNERRRRNNNDIVENEVYRRVNWVIHAIQGERVPEEPTLRDAIKKGVKAAGMEDIVGPKGKHPSEDIDSPNPFNHERLSSQIRAREGGDS